MTDEEFLLRALGNGFEKTASALNFEAVDRGYEEFDAATAIKNAKGLVRKSGDGYVITEKGLDRLGEVTG